MSAPPGRPVCGRSERSRRSRANERHPSPQAISIPPQIGRISLRRLRRTGDDNSAKTDTLRQRYFTGPATKAELDQSRFVVAAIAAAAIRVLSGQLLACWALAYMTCQLLTFRPAES